MNFHKHFRNASAGVHDLPQRRARRRYFPHDGWAFAYTVSSCLLVAASGCAADPVATDKSRAIGVAAVAAAPAPTVVTNSEHPDIDYLIAPGDALQVFVWRNPELSVSVPVRPDGRVSLPLVEDIGAAGKRPVDLARDIEKSLAFYIKEPRVTVIVTHFGGAYNQQVKVVGQAANPQALPFRQGMTLLDVMIAVGGLTEFAAGNRATIVRSVGGKRSQIKVRLSDLFRDGDIAANVDMLPGDVLIIPEAWF